MIHDVKNGGLPALRVLCPIKMYTHETCLVSDGPHLMQCQVVNALEFASYQAKEREI